MSEIRHEVEDYIKQIDFPVTKEELINGLLVRNAPGRLIVLVERLPRDQYDHRQDLRRDLAEIDHFHAREIAQANSYEEFLAVVLEHVGDIRHTTKAAYNRVVERVMYIAVEQGSLRLSDARSMELRLIAAFADLRGTMDEVYDEKAPINPEEDLPRTRS
jgi:hypothetical protein